MGRPLLLWICVNTWPLYAKFTWKKTSLRNQMSRLGCHLEKPKDCLRAQHSTLEVLRSNQNKLNHTDIWFQFHKEVFFHMNFAQRGFLCDCHFYLIAIVTLLRTLWFHEKISVFFYVQFCKVPYNKLNSFLKKKKTGHVLTHIHNNRGRPTF